MNFLKNNDEITLSIRQVTALVAFFLLSSFAFFVIGYAIGQRYTVDSFIDESSRQSITNQICTSLYCTQNSDQPVADANNEDAVSSSVASEHSTPESIVAPVDQIAPVIQIETEEKVSVPVQSTRYYAPLIGYGTLKAAEQFIERWNKQGIELSIKKLISKSAKGKQVTWYQVRTPEFTNKDDLENMVAIISRKERLKNVTILEI